jgi:hypothetical protein
MNERDLIVAYLRDTADFWKKEASRLGTHNIIGVAMAEAKAGALDGVAVEVENGAHQK